MLYFLQPLFLARADNLPGWRAELLQTVKECFRQILKVQFQREAALNVHNFCKILCSVVKSAADVA